MASSSSGGDISQSFCTSCGEGIDQAVQYCPHCGAATRTEVAQSPAAPSGGKRTDHIKYRNMVVRVLYSHISHMAEYPSE